MLVVIAIIGVLMAILLPAVQAARESGRRVTCTSNLKQMGLAANRFNDARRSIPGWRNAVTVPAGTSFFSWPVMLLPFMERRDIWNAIGNGTLSPAPYISFFACPSSPPDALSSPWLAYAGSAGSGLASGTGTGVMVDAVPATLRVSMDQVAGNDGTSRTIIFSEACGPQISSQQGTWNVQPNVAGAITWAGAVPPVTQGQPAVFGMVSTTPYSGIKVINSGTLGSNSVSGYLNMPNSQHPSGTLVAFCDGHVEFLRDSLPYHVYAQLMSWNNLMASGNNLTSPSIAPYSNWIKRPDNTIYNILQDGDYQ